MNNEILVNYYTIDGNDYLVVNKEKYKDNDYVYLVNESNNKDILIRKVNGSILEPLNSKKELFEVMKLIIK